MKRCLSCLCLAFTLGAPSVLPAQTGLPKPGLNPAPMESSTLVRVTQVGNEGALDALPRPTPVPPPKPDKQTDLEKAKELEAQAQLNKLREAYQGPFMLASDLFDGTAAFSASPSASVSDDYRLGAGDEMLLYGFGAVTFEFPLVVDRTGSVTIPKVGSAQVAGLRLGDARRVVQKLVNNLYGGSRTDLQFTHLRDVRVFILGEVYRPGSHVVPSLTSILNALAASGGPGPHGSYRDIRLIRDGKVIQTLDLYALRLKGVGMESVLMRDGDTLFVPIADRQILMEGAFVRVASSPVHPEHPGVLVELKPGETAWHALEFIGGLQPSAFRDLVTVLRTDPDGVTNVENLALDPGALHGHSLYDKDVVRALVQAERQEGVVEVAGFAKVPGLFQYRTGMAVKDLLGNPDQIQPDTYLGRGQIIRTLPDGATELLTFDVGRALRGEASQNLKLSPRDKVSLYQVEALRLKRTVKVLGPFTSPGTFPWHDKMRAADLIFAAGVPELRADRYYAELAHFSPDSKVSDVVKLDLSRLLYTEDHVPALEEALNPLLRPFDQITLYEMPDFQVHRTVTISGQVNRPGSYTFAQDHFTLRQLIDRAGGLTPEAMPKGGIFLRNSVREKDLTEADLKKVGLKALDPTGQGMNEILQRLSETKRTKDTGTFLNNPVLHGLMAGTSGRLVVDFQAALMGDPRRDVELLDGDTVIIPRLAETAYVVGEVASPFANFRVQKGDSVRDIIGLAGGFTRNADTGEVRLLKADGRILDSQVMGQTVEAGDAVLVPQRFRLNTTWQDNLQALMPIALLLNVATR